MPYTSWRGVVGVIKPTHRPGSLEEFIRLTPDGVGVIPLFLDVRRGTVEEFTEAINAYDAKVAQLAELGVDVIHPEGAPPFMLQGFEGERAITERWEDRFGLPVVTSGQVQVEALRALGMKKIVGATYTSGQTNDLVAKYFAEAGITMAEFAAMEVPFADAGQISHHEVYTHTKRAFLRHPDADGILLFGSGWRSLDAIAPLEQDLGVPVVHAVTSRVWAIEQRLRVHHPVQGYGRLLAEMPPLIS